MKPTKQPTAPPVLQPASNKATSNDFALAVPAKAAARQSTQQPTAKQTTPRLQVSQAAKPVAKPTAEQPKFSADSTKPANTETFEPTQVLAMVGGQPIFVGDAMLQVNQLIEQHMANAPEDIKNRERRGLLKRLLPKLVDEKMLYVSAVQDLPEEADIEKVVEQASKEFDEKALPDILKRAKVKDAAAYDAILRGMGSSLRKRRDAWAREQVTRYLVSEKIETKKEITHQQLLDEYRANIETYKFAAKSKWEQIMVRFDRFDSKAEAREAIGQLGNRLVYGANLSALAKKSSHGYRASEGGQHDWTGRDALVLKEIDDAIFTLPIGELSDIIETRDGLHIVRVIDRKEAGIKPFTEAQVDIKERLIRKMRNDAFDKHLAHVKKSIPVEYFTLESADVAARPGDENRR